MATEKRFLFIKKYLLFIRKTIQSAITFEKRLQQIHDAYKSKLKSMKIFRRQLNKHS